MKNAKHFNLKNMKETIVNYSGCNSELDKIWDSFYLMANLGFISSDTWGEFSEECAGWYVDEKHGCVRNERNDSVVWEYTPDAEYRA